MLQFQRVSKQFNSDLFKSAFTALDEVSFSIKPGRIVGFLGANGAGKTTSFKILMDFIRPTSGSVIFDKRLGEKKTDIFKKIGFLPERPYFYPYLKGREFCYFMGELAGMKKKDIAAQILKWAPRFEIDFALDREIKSYSKGMLQRIGFLITVLHRPELIILDEPLSGLDPIGRKSLKEIIKNLNDNGKTIFFSSHIVSDLEEVSHDVIFLKESKVYFEGSVKELMQKHSTQKVKIQYKENEVIKNLEVEKSQLNKTLSSVLDQKCEVLLVKEIRPSLEEVIYHVK